jgi:hypothetical protein
MTLQIDLLYTGDCNGWELADELLRQALADLGLEAEITYWLIESDRQAIAWDFPGSPSIRVNGRDLFPTRDMTAGLKLRSYATEEGMRAYPTYAMFYNALRSYAK